MKISTQAEKNPELSRVSKEVIVSIGGGKRSNSGIATKVRPSNRFPGHRLAIACARFAMREMGYTEIENCGMRHPNSSVWARYSNGKNAFFIGSYDGCGVNFEIRQEKLA